MCVCLISRSTIWNTCAGVVGGPLLWWHIVSCCPLSLAHRTHTLTATSLIMQTPCATSTSLPVSILTQVQVFFQTGPDIIWGVLNNNSGSSYDPLVYVIFGILFPCQISHQRWLTLQCLIQMTVLVVAALWFTGSIIKISASLPQWISLCCSSVSSPSSS